MPGSLADHVSAAQEMARQSAGAVVPFEGDGAIDNGVAQAGGLLDKAPLVAGEVVGEDHLVVEEAQLVEVVDNDVGPFPDLQSAAVP